MPKPGRDSGGPYPSVGSALMLTLLAILAAGFTGVAFIDFGLLAAVGIGQAIGIGAVATMGAKRVPEPQAERLGLRALDPEAIPVILCLVPAILLASELDNIAYDWTPEASEAGIERSLDDPNRVDDTYGEEANVEPGTEVPSGDTLPAFGAETAEEIGIEDETPTRLIDPDDPAAVLQAIVVMVGIVPIVEEFLYRGVIQQGLVQRLGLIRGVSMTALLWTLLRPAPIAGFPRFLAAVIASFALGWALGIVRVATRSILGPILLSAGWAAIGLGAMVMEERMELPGMNVEGTHLPLLISGASLALVAWAGWTIYQEAERRFDPNPRPRPPEEGGPEV